MDLCLGIPLGRASASFKPERGKVFIDAAIGARGPSVCFDDESACLKVKIHSMGWAFMLRSG